MTERKCPACGAEVPASSAICPNCKVVIARIKPEHLEENQPKHASILQTATMCHVFGILALIGALAAGVLSIVAGGPIGGLFFFFWLLAGLVFVTILFALAGIIGAVVDIEANTRDMKKAVEDLKKEKGEKEDGQASE